MSLTKSTLTFILDANKPNMKLDYNFLQGNTDKNFNIYIAKDGVLQNISSNVKPKMYYIYYDAYMSKKNTFVFDETTRTPNYDITVSNNLINVPANILMTDWAGTVQAILEIEDSGTFYTYSFSYFVNENLAYKASSFVSNIPDMDNLKLDVAALKSSSTDNTNKITVLENTVTLKANNDLSNVGQFQSASDGAILIKKDGTLKDSGITIDATNKKILSPYSLKVPANSIELGENISIHENGGFMEFDVQASNKTYLLLDYLNDATNGTEKPIYYERGPLIIKSELQSVDTTTMNNITSIDIGTPSENRQIQAIYMNFVDRVDNLTFRLSVNGKDVAYYPSKLAWEGKETGLTVFTGLQKIPLKPFWTNLTTYNSVIYMKASTPINLKGNGTKPYFAIDKNIITLKQIALMEDVNSVQDTAESIKNKLQGLTGDNRLDATAIKNVASASDVSNLAKKDLSNIDNKDFKTKSVASGLLQQDLEDVDLQKLHDKGIDAKLLDSITIGELHGNYTQGTIKEIQLHNNLDLTLDQQNNTATISIADVYAGKDLKNVLTADLDKAIRLTNAYKEIANKHPDTPTPVEVETSLLYLEETSNIIDWTQYANNKFLYLAYQFNSDNESITQTLPPVSENKAIIVSLIGNGENPTLILNPSGVDHIDGSLSPITLNEKGIQGVLISEKTNNNYAWVPYAVMHENGITVADDKSNVHIGIQTLEFKGATLTTDVTDAKKSIINIDSSTSGSSLSFLDGLTGKTFTPTKVQSLDKSIRISDLNGVADFSKGESNNEGIHVCLGNNEIINSKNGKSKLYFGDTRVKGGMYVYPDMDTKSFVLQDIDPQDDPNVSGGSTFIIALYYEPNSDFKNQFTQDGKIELELVDDNDVLITDVNNQPMGVIIDYKANDIAKPMLYIGECQIKAFTRVHLKINPIFANEEMISIGANTQLCIQSINKNESSGLALLSFMAFTGYNIKFNTKYYGYNSLNMASRLIYNAPEIQTGVTQLNFGQNLYINFQSNMKVSIDNYNLIIKDDGVALPNFSITKYYDRLDSENISGKTYKITAKLTDKDNAFRVALLNYTGNITPAPIPKVESYSNAMPVFTSGWVKVDDMFISEDAVSGEHTESKNFTIPNNSKGIAIIMYSDNSIPMTLRLKDLEGDITPWFTKVVITDNSNIAEKYLMAHDYFYKSIVYTPNGYSALRYTVNSTDTKVPFGVVSGGDGKVINDNAWTDAGSIDPQKAQGDIKFLTDGKVKMSYTARIFNEQNSLNQVQFWVAKVGQGNTFTEVPNSKTATTIENARTKPKIVTSQEFDFEVVANETYRIFAKSDKNDGFYLQSGTDGTPLFSTIIEFEELTTSEKDIFDKTNEIRFMDNGQEIYNKMLEYDVTTGKMKVVDK